MAQIIALTRVGEARETVLVNMDLVTVVLKTDTGSRLFFNDPARGFEVADQLNDIYKRVSD